MPRIAPIAGVELAGGLTNHPRDPLDPTYGSIGPLYNIRVTNK